MSARIEARPVAMPAMARPGYRLPRARTVAGDYLSLTKPRIIVLLLITELTAMVVAAHALPDVRQSVAVAA